MYEAQCKPIHKNVLKLNIKSHLKLDGPRLFVYLNLKKYYRDFAGQM